MAHSPRCASAAPRQESPSQDGEGAIDRFSTEELFEQACGNFIAVCTGTYAFLQQRGIDPRELDAYLGEKRAPGWAEIQGNVEQAAHYVALNMAAAGFATSSRRDGDIVEIEAKWTDWHDDPEWARGELDAKAAMTSVVSSFEPIMASIALSSSYEGTDEGFVIRVSE